MNLPTKLYRYRPLKDGCSLEHELSALKDSYVFSPSFADMNDPMEAFYETGDLGDGIVNAILAPAGKQVDALYSILSKMVDRLALVSFASSHENLPMWAYYGSNFAGMCLEFETEELVIGDLQSEKLCPVTYARNALPPLKLTDFGAERLEEAVISRITRKRSEWAHEKEWRFVTGEVGPKHYLDDALRRVFLGPLVKPEHAARVCQVLDKRPVEVLKGEIKGFELTFRSIQPARPLDECERVGACEFDPAKDLLAESELRDFLLVPFEKLLEECRRISLRPNMERLYDVDLSGTHGGTIYFSTIYKLRSGREVYHKRYFDK